MSYSDLPAKSSGDVFGLSEYEQIDDNFRAGMPAIISAKGDLGVGTGPDAIARLPVGSNGAILVADSSQALGVRWQIVPAAHVYGGVFDPATSAWVTINTHTNELYDFHGMHSNVTTPERLTVPSGGAGLYSLGAIVQFATSSEGSNVSNFGLGVRFFTNGTTPIGDPTLIQLNWSNATPSNDIYLSHRLNWELAAAQFVTLQVYTTRDINVSNSRFWAQWLRSA